MAYGPGAWSPGTKRDPQGTTAVVFAGAQKERIEIPNRAGRLDVNHFSILVRFTLNESIDTDPAHQRYEFMEKPGSFWFNIREDTNPRYRLRVADSSTVPRQERWADRHPEYGCSHHRHR
jgi:hypothetical protein